MKATNLQDVFLNQVRKDRTPITIFLVNGYQIRGTIRGFDNYIIVLDVEGKQQIVYKHAVSTISPLTPVRFVAAETEEDENE